MSGDKVRLGFLASGKGSNMAAIIANCNTGKLDAKPVVVVSNNRQAGALQLADQFGLPSFHLSSRTHENVAALDVAITRVLEEYAVDFVVLAGYMRKVGPHLLRRFGKYVFNIHPSLLPKYGGLGMFGMSVHEAVLQAGERETGATVHMVNSKYDHGAICAQQSVPVLADDTPKSLAARVLRVEHELYTKTLKKQIQCYFEQRSKLDIALEKKHD